MTKGHVLQAEPYRPLALESYGDAEYMLIRQYEFPDSYDGRDVFQSVDSDRCFQFDHDHASKCYQTHVRSGGEGLERWFQSAYDDRIMAFLKEFMRADANVAWTGYRILGTVNRSNGYVVWSFQLFAKHPDSDTKTYTGPNAPNVKPMQIDDAWPHRMGY